MRILFLLFFCIACESIKYQEDIGYVSSAVANSPEAPLFVDGKICKDIDNKVGICAKRVLDGQSVDISILPTQYNYKISLECSKNTGISFSQDVVKGNKFLFTIKKEHYNVMRVFSCIGELFPSDRTEGISAKFIFIINIVDKSYVPRESIYIYQYKKRYYLVLGSHSRYATVNENDIGYITKEQTTFNTYKNAKLTAISESYNMRYSYYGY